MNTDNNNSPVMDGARSSQARMEHALKQLRFYGKVLKFGIPKDTYNNTVIQEGLTAPFNSEEELEAKKLLIAAAVETVYNSQKVPDDCKEELATLNAREILEMFDFVKVECMEMTPEDRLKQLEKNSFAKRAALINAAKDIILDCAYLLHSVHTIVAAARGDLLDLGIYSMLEMIPQSWKDLIDDKSTKAILYASKRISYEFEYYQCIRAHKVDVNEEEQGHRLKRMREVIVELQQDIEREYCK